MVGTLINCFFGSKFVYRLHTGAHLKKSFSCDLRLFLKIVFYYHFSTFRSDIATLSYTGEIVPTITVQVYDFLSL